MTKKIVIVTQWVEVEVDESKFTKEFTEEFTRYFYPFYTIDDHLKHLAQMEARGFSSDTFIEGYGDPKEFGIKMKIVDQEEEIER